MTKASDEMLMAFADGELDARTAEEIRRLAEGDPSVAARIAEFQRSRELAREAFEAIRGEPVPASLANAVRKAARTRPQPQRRPARFSHVPHGAFAMAAALVLSLGTGFLAGRILVPDAPGAAPLVGAGPIADALGQTGGGEDLELEWAGGPAVLSTRATYPVAGGLCRSFELAASSRSVLGVGCSGPDRWRIDLAMAQPQAQNGAFAPASGETLAALDAYLDSLEAGPALPAGQ